MTFRLLADILTSMSHPLQMLCDSETTKDSTIRVMPDVHPGKVGTIGLTMTVGSQLMINLTGIDVGCGMTIAQIKGKKSL